MESLRKKKKLSHHHTGESDDDDSLVKIILSDNIYENYGLDKQLGGNKIIVQRATFKDLNSIQNSPIANKNIKCITSNQHNLYILDEKQCFEYNFTMKSWTLKFNLITRTYLLSHFQIDNQGKNVYIYSREVDCLRKYEINQELIQKWELYNVLSFVFCESKNEIYIFNSTNRLINVHDLNGILKRSININQKDKQFQKMLYDEKEEEFYIYFKYDNNRSNRYNCELVIINEKTNSEQDIIINNNINSIFFPQGNYYSIMNDCGEVGIYEKKTNKSLCEYPPEQLLNIHICHFDENVNVLYYCKNYDSNINVMQMNFTINRQDIPITRESYLYLSKLGVEFPTMINCENSMNYKTNEFLEFLDNLSFRNIYCWYIDEDIYLGFDLSTFLGYFNRLEKFTEDKFEVSIIVNRLKDFQIQINYKKLPDSTHSTKCLTFSEFLSKLKMCDERFGFNNVIYLVNFELIYAELLRKSIINTETKMMDHLIEKFKPFYDCGFKKWKDVWNNTQFSKMDLFVLALEFCSEPAIVKWETKIKKLLSPELD